MTEDDNKPFGSCQDLPEDVQAIFQDLCEDLVSLHGKWQLYLDLFSDRETVDLLNDVAMASFQMLEESLRSDMTMSICRLTDPPQSCGKDNLSIKVLVDRLGHVRGLTALWDNFHACCNRVRDYRNKRVGHNDLHVALRPHDNPLPNVTRADIEAILAAGAELINHAYRDYVEGGELCFQPLHIGGGKDLVQCLKSGWEHDQVEHRRLLGGTAPGSG